MRRRPAGEEQQPQPAAASAAEASSQGGKKRRGGSTSGGGRLLRHWRLISVVVGVGVFALSHHWEYWGKPLSLWASVKRALWAGTHARRVVYM